MTPSRKALAARMIDLWNAGQSASDIARELNIRSRGIVMGLLHRAKAKGVFVATKKRSTPVQKKVKKERRIVAKPLPKIAVLPWAPCEPATPAAPLRALGLTLWQLKPMNCRFVFDDATYCGLTATHRSYCPAHAALVYQPRRDEHDARSR